MGPGMGRKAALKDNFMDNGTIIRLFSGFMAEPGKKLVTRASLAVDAVVVLGFFIFMYWVASSHVPSNDPAMIRIWGAVTSACLSAVVWLALQMFRVTFRAQREAGKK
jgi:hypothetical protein